ncbi:MAG TPA: GNAT family protein [Fimbriimonas sp.]|nr:GNAT family protein [Fimbriimonas sp.]
MFGPDLEAGRTRLGEPVRLCSPAFESLPKMVEWLNDPEVMRFLNTRWQPTTFETEVNRLRDLQQCEDQILWHVEVGQSFVGATWINEIKRPEMTGVFGVMLGDKGVWRTGVSTAVGNAVASYAFREEGFSYLYTNILEPNLASKKRALRAGFKEYGVKPSAGIVDGRICDEWLGALSREEWLATLEDRRR